MEEQFQDICGVEVIYEEESNEEEEEIQIEDLEQAPPKMEDNKPQVHDPMEEVNLDIMKKPRITYISSLLSTNLKKQIISLLQEFKDCFAWNYDEMLGFDRGLVEHCLPIRLEFHPFQQPPRRMSKEVELKVKEENEKLLKAKFIRPTRYVQWLENIVPGMKKNGKLRVCVDFRDLNVATLKDMYMMPISDMLVDSITKNELFMDCFSNYNQILIAVEDILKIAFRCLGSIGTFEWLVMPFGLKNVGATYQRAMNAIFHDMIGHHKEVYIDDIVVKSKRASEHTDHLRKSFERMRHHRLKLNPLKCAFGVHSGNFLGFLVHQRRIEVDENKAKAIDSTNAPQNKKELQKFLG